MATIGYGRTRKELIQVVKRILDEDGRPTPFKNNTPGKDWLNGFFSRHPQLSLRTTLQLGKERAIISPEKIEKWFSDFEAYIKNEVKDPDVMKDPSRLYNADESGFSFCSTTGKVIGCKGAPVVYNYGNSSKQQLTVLACASANGHFCPPMIVYPGQRFSFEPLDGFEDAHMGRSETGWMDSELFCHWLLTCFIPALESRCVKRPVILFLDGHSTHVSLEASDICVANGIELYCLLEHSSHIMQPLDLRLFSVLKQNWKEAVRAFQVENVGEFVTKRTFAKVFRSAWEKSAQIEIAVKGFVEAGLFPFCPERVTKSVKLEPSRLFQTPAPKLDKSSESCDDTTNLESTEACSRPTDVDANAPSHTSSLPQVPSPSHAQLDSVVETAPMAVVASASITDACVTNVADTPVKGAEFIPGASTAPESPFSKHLKYPTVPASNSKRKKPLPTPKAITGHGYRKLLQEKRALKEKQEKEKQQRKEERLRKKELKEQQDKIKKLRQLERKNAMQERKRKALEKFIEKATASDSDDAAVVATGKCYKCEQSYKVDFIECDKCFRKFHIACVQEEMIDDVPFECNYC